MSINNGADRIEHETQYLLDMNIDLIIATYDLSSSHHTAANRALITLQESLDLQTKANTILEKVQNRNSRFFSYKCRTIIFLPGILLHIFRLDEANLDEDDLSNLRIT